MLSGVTKSLGKNMRMWLSAMARKALISLKRLTLIKNSSHFFLNPSWYLMLVKSPLPKSVATSTSRLKAIGLKNPILLCLTSSATGLLYDLITTPLKSTIPLRVKKNGRWTLPVPCFKTWCMATASHTWCDSRCRLRGIWYCCLWGIWFLRLIPWARRSCGKRIFTTRWAFYLGSLLLRLRVTTSLM